MGEKDLLYIFGVDTIIKANKIAEEKFDKKKKKLEELKKNIKPRMEGVAYIIVKSDYKVFYTNEVCGSCRKEKCTVRVFFCKHAMLCERCISE